MRIANINIPLQKHIVIGLTSIYGIGRSAAQSICQKASLDPTTKVKEITEAQAAQIRSIIESEHKVEGDLRREIAMAIKRLKDINSYRGARHRRGLPARGQRTRTNARTRKGKKKSKA